MHDVSIYVCFRKSISDEKNTKEQLDDALHFWYGPTHGVLLDINRIFQEDLHDIKDT